MSLIASKLREKLLSALESDGENLILETVKAIQSTLDCDVCSLWSINHNNTDLEIGEFVSASLLMQCTSEGYMYPENYQEDYVHPLKGSFDEFVLNTTSKNGKILFQCDVNDEKCEKHLSNVLLKRMELSLIICILIKENEKKDATTFVKMAYKKHPFDIYIIDEEIAIIINKAIVSAISRYQYYQKQQILDELITNYAKNKSTLKDIFHPVIHRIFKNYFDYEGSSVFIWDSFDNRHNLLVTTGLEPYEGEAYYENGEGLSGMAASEKKAKIYDNLEELEKKDDPRYLHKYREKTHYHGTTLLAIPILCPSNPDKALGIIRFTNKKNKFSKKGRDYVLDYFNDVDVDLIKNASHYLAMIVDNYLSEEERKDFISKMSHEFKTPANAIRVTAERALRKYKMNDTRFMRLQFEHYMQSIVDYTDLQLMQVTTNLFMTKHNRKNRPNYDIGNYSIISIIEESINIIRPIARNHGATFNNIRMADGFPNIKLKVCKNAFKMVFYNLLTNSIKYRVPNTDLQVLFSAEDNSEGLIINVSDSGIGVAPKDAIRIFLLGVRSDNARRINAEGYGIGLLVTKLIIEAFGGEIRLSNYKNPTTFEIKLPRTLYV